MRSCWVFSDGAAGVNDGAVGEVSDGADYVGSEEAARVANNRTVETVVMGLMQYRIGKGTVGTASDGTVVVVRYAFGEIVMDSADVTVSKKVAGVVSCGTARVGSDVVANNNRDEAAGSVSDAAVGVVNDGAAEEDQQ